MSDHSNHFTESEIEIIERELRELQENEPDIEYYEEGPDTERWTTGEDIDTQINKLEKENGEPLTMKEYKAVYYKMNKQRIVCDVCGGKYETSSKSTHAKSIKHYNALNPDNPKPKRTNKPKVPKPDIIV